MAAPTLPDSLPFDNLIVIAGLIRDVEKSHGKLSTAVPKEIIHILQLYLKKLKSIIIDNGSAVIKAGVSGDDLHQPSVVFPSIFGGHGMPPIFRNVGLPGKAYYVGHEALSKRGILRLSHPIERGIISNFDTMEKIWEFTFDDELKLSPQDLNACNVLLTEPPLNPNTNRERTVKIMFEQFNVNGCYLACDAVLALYATGRTTGCVYSSGDIVSYIVPVHEGAVVSDAVIRQDLGGRDVTDYLVRLLHEKGYSFTTLTERYILDTEIKQKICYVALDFEKEMLNWKESSFELPDGEVITVGNEIIRAPEIIFNPGVMGFSVPGLSVDGMDEFLWSGIMKCDKDLRRIMLENIVLCGGNTMFRGLDKRIQKEMERRMDVNEDFEVNVIVGENSQYSTWIGGNVFVRLNQMEKLLITRYEYNEYGPSIVHRRCVK